jgi:hypothetical protein
MTIYRYVALANSHSKRTELPSFVTYFLEKQTVAKNLCCILEKTHKTVESASINKTAVTMETVVNGGGVKLKTSPNEVCKCRGLRLLYFGLIFVIFGTILIVIFHNHILKVRTISSNITFS